MAEKANKSGDFGSVSLFIENLRLSRGPKVVFTFKSKC